MPLTVLNVGYPLAPVSPDTPGGAEQILAYLDDAVVEAGHRSIVIAPDGSSVRGTLVAVPEIKPPLSDHKRAFIWEQQRNIILRVLSDIHVDVIHMHGIDFHRYLPETAIPIVVTMHLPPSWYPAEIFRQESRNVYLVCVSSSQARQCPPGAEIDVVIGNGVQLGDFSPTKKQGYAVALGRICPEKGFHLALDAATQAGVPLIVAGKVFGYSAHEEYWSRELQPRLRSPHRFIGVVGPKQKRKLLAGARCLIVSSLVEETSSLVAMEAMAVGTPVVALRRGALSEIIEHACTGFLVDRPEDLHIAISASEHLSSLACRQRAETFFSVERMTTEYLTLYRELASGRRGAMRPAVSEPEAA